MNFSFNDILANNINIDRLSKNDYVSIINVLVSNYKILLLDKSNNVYINEINSLSTQLNIQNKELLELKENYNSLASKLTKPLTAKERIIGKIDLKKITKAQ